jgi:hypothetical protein
MMGGLQRAQPPARLVAYNYAFGALIENNRVEIEELCKRYGVARLVSSDRRRVRSSILR